MESRGPSHHHQHHLQPPPHQHHHHHNHHKPPQQPPQAMMVHPQHYPFSPNIPNSSTIPQMIATPNSSSSPNILQNNRFPFTSSQVATTSPPSPPPQQPKTTPTTGLDSPFSGDGSRQSGFGIDPKKKKRGRPRKYSPDGGGNNIALGLSPTPLTPTVVGSGVGQADSGGTALSPENSSKKHRGRPPSSSKKQLDALGNCGVGFTPHVIFVNAGEDIAEKIIAFSKQGPRTVCVLSANGSICNVSLRQPANSGGIVNYEGRFEIISLSGSFLFSENTDKQVQTGGLSVSLAGSDGRVLGGGVVGMLMAATTVQIILGSFIANGKKTKYMPAVLQSHVLSFAAPPLPAPESPPSQEISSEEESEENVSNHIDRTIGSYGNSNHPVHNMHMYNSMGWPNSATKSLQN